MIRTKYLLLASVISLGAIGCGETADPGKTPDGGSGNPDGGSGNSDGAVNPDSPPAAIDQPASVMRTSQFAGNAVRRLGSSMGFATGSDSVLSRLGGRVFGSGSDSQEPTPPAPKVVVPQPLPQLLMDRLLETPAAKSLRPRPRFLALATEEENFDAMAADVESFFKDRLFASQNVDSMTMTSVTYLLKGDPTCRPLPSEIMDGAVDRVAVGCASDLLKLQVRIVVTADGDGYRFQILLGPDKLELSVIIIHSDLVAWEADLAQARMATDYANMVLRTDAERLEGEKGPLPFTKLQGRIRLALKVDGDKKATVSLTVLEALEIEMDNHNLAMKASTDPVIAVSGDGTAQTVSVKLAVPQTDLRMPWDPKDTGAQNTDLHASIGGLWSQTTVSEMAEEVAFVGVGVGPSFVEVRGTKIFELGFNTQDGNKMDLTVKPLENDQVRFTVSPKIDLSLAFKLMGVASEFNEAPDSFLLNETYSIRLDGTAPLIVETVAETDTFEGGFKMVSGNLSLSTTSSDTATVSVPQGQCLTENPTPAEGSHKLLGELMSAACP
jgi:hypothetical protein